MNLSGRKGPNVHTEFKEKPNFICHRFKNLKGRKSASALLSFSRQSGGKKKNHSWSRPRNGSSQSQSRSPQHFKSQKTLSALCTTVKEMSPSLIEMDFFFFFPPLLLYYRSADGLFSHCDKRAQSRAQRDTWAGRRRWRRNNNNNKRRKKRAHQFWLQEDGNELKPEYLINKMLKYWGSGSVWPVCALCAQDIYSICVCLRLYVCILNMLLLSPAGRTQHCILPSLLSWFGLGFFVFFWLRWKKKKSQHH